MKLTKKETKDKELKLYDYYIGLDWSQEGAAIARLRSNGDKPKKQDIAPNIKAIKEYLKELKGEKILTIEETTGSHWLYVELKDCVDKIIICNPARNKLLSEGGKTDKIDAGKLSELLRGGLIKPVYHTDDDNNYKIRKLVSAYDDLVKADVRIQNQHSAIYRSIGLRAKKDNKKIKDKTTSFITEHQITVREILVSEKKKFEELFKQTLKENKVIKDIDGISGFGHILSVKAYGIIIDASRFKNKYGIWAYAGLVKNKRESGKTSYYIKNKKYSRALNYVFKSATRNALSGRNDIREYYEYLLKKGPSTEGSKKSDYQVSGNFSLCSNKK